MLAQCFRQHMGLLFLAVWGLSATFHPKPTPNRLPTSFSISAQLRLSFRTLNHLWDRGRPHWLWIDSNLVLRRRLRSQHITTPQNVGIAGRSHSDT
ncbi:hypothetical protein C8R43DRAFT_82367 [Mycena crocata]|nr:hypothetical protein C8R43DRAFT_82367 [Mycena crocata]